MLSRDLGGIQQAFVDYSDALKMQNHKVMNISSLGAKINGHINSNFKLPNLGSFCFISKLFLKLLILVYKPDIVICHGNRAIIFTKAFNTDLTKIVGVAHNYSYKYLKKCDYILTLTNRLKNHLIQHGIPAGKLLQFSNMVRIENHYEARPFHSPITIGTFGRFVEKKGFIYLIDSISILIKKGYYVNLHIGGAGKEAEKLKNRTRELGLEQIVFFDGWIHDKKSFFNKIDIFCLPSIQEPFGIILLEAMQYSKPIVATKSGGPEELLIHGREGLIADIASSEELALNLEKLIKDQNFSMSLSKNAYDKLKEDYDIKILSEKLSAALINIVK